ncbi:16S rRNA (cytidine(1402)-2'-O)-methyltransferase [Litorivita pollutaquae]|uniref:Ribosomal RNA small subunit methyltransferase I n=1 Tax=Litorivita pollutaquae TaxID=2200892 RepID=A0A2V4MUF2_9RHOB|nr:16S rRNA (cytidine(1402)-2'-O)-methyltransferase [Litorivita pollutaquae]OUS22466.1 16S rRNA (cytidine(1402)-2'-O)-methyltransferase [Rhodobacterales bacterium 59_46_T64]PYC47868.1 16S rRNA (cytidine(1402)-2'-O)-methyltransferase [Litorivita pollutaquae]
MNQNSAVYGAKNGPLAGGLYLVATPIGTARDITLRALDILASADVLAAEDTRSMRKLMDIHGIAVGDRPMVSYHDHNGGKIRPRLLQYLAEGKSVAYGSEAGTPLVADPGFDLARAAREAGHLVTSAPGPSAVITALTVAGLPTDRFMFAGFLPNAKGQRKSALAALKDVPATLAFYESPKRIAAMLRDAAEVMGADRQAAVCRELTKKFEEVLRGTLLELAQICADRSLKGEIVVLIDRGHLPSVNQLQIEQEVNKALADMSVRDAADMVSTRFDLPRRQVYQIALELDKNKT